jgi:hypothetical protein
MKVGVDPFDKNMDRSLHKKGQDIFLLKRVSIMGKISPHLIQSMLNEFHPEAFCVFVAQNGSEQKCVFLDIAQESFDIIYGLCRWTDIFHIIVGPFFDLLLNVIQNTLLVVVMQIEGRAVKVRSLAQFLDVDLLERFLLHKVKSHTTKVACFLMPPFGGCLLEASDCLSTYTVFAQRIMPLHEAPHRD